MKARFVTRSLPAALIGAALAFGCAPAESAGDADAAKKSTGDSDVVARVGGEEITLAQVEEQISADLRQLEQQRYEKIREALGRMIDDKLIEAEAAEQGVDAQSLFQAEVAAKATDPTEAEIKQFYDQNKNRVQGRPLDQLRGQIAQFLKNQKMQEVQRAYLDSLRAERGVQMLLEAPRVELTVPAQAKTKGGGAQAPVTIVEFADFECGYCRRSHPTVERLLTEYGDKVQFAFVDYPLDFHKRAIPASVAARCAGDQDKFWDYYENLMVMTGDLGDADLRKRAESLGLDMTQFDQCYQTNEYASLIEDHMQLGRELGVTGTPTFFINGRMLVGAKPYEELKSVIDEELAKAS